MPTVLRSGPYRFFFFSGDRKEPPHVHVRREWREAKIWIAPVLVAYGGDFRPAELEYIIRIVRENQEVLLRSWYEHFKG
jgi:hypothetical protein